MVVGEVDARQVVFEDVDRAADKLARDGLDYVDNPKKHLNHH